MRYAVTAFGLVLLGLCSVAGAQTFSQIYNFQGGSDGGNPYAGVTRDAAGNLYGTTYSDGNFNCPNGGCGVVYKIDPQGNEIPLYSFTGTPDGANPVAGVVADTKGNLYGTTKFGGAKGYGTVYEVSPSGAEKILVSFTGGADGGIPNGGLVMDKGGNLYGTTFDGGSAGFGTVFKLSASGAFTTLYSFPDMAHGMYPNAALLLDDSGDLYGTTQYGGVSDRGTVFKLDSAGRESVLYSFSGADGAYPEAPLVIDGSGNLYGTTTGGGNSDLGTAFRLTPGGIETVLHSFTGSPDGEYPISGVVLDSAGNLYGTTYQGGRSGGAGFGSSNAGVVYKIDAAGNESLLYTFQGMYDGQWPIGGLTLSPDGKSLYGAAEMGGSFCCGDVFQITLPSAQ